MRSLIDSSSLRRLKMLELLNASDDWWTIEEIALHLNCSVRSVKADIYYYNTFSSPSIKLITSNRHGVKLILPDSFQLESMYQEILAENINSQIMECLYQEKFDSIEEYAENLFTSTTSIIRSIKQINLFLEKYQLSIQKKPMRIVGSEKQIRYFYSVFFWEKYGSKLDGSQHPGISEARQIIQKIKKRKDLSISPIMENKLSLCLLICLERISKGYTLQQYTAPVEVSETVLEVIEDLLKDIPLNISNYEIEFMGFYFANRYLNPDPQLKTLSQEQLTTFQSIGQFLTSVSEKNSFVLPNKEAVQRSIFHCIVYKREFHGRNYFLANRTKNTLVNIDKIYHPFMNLVTTEVEGWPNSGWMAEVKDEVSEFLYLLIIQWKGLTAQILHLQEKISVLIISQFGKTHEFFLADVLQSYFPNELDCFSMSEKKYEKLKIEVVVTDVQVEVIRKKWLREVPVIGIEYAPNERNLKAIRSMLTEIKQSKDANSSWVNAYSPFD